MVKNSGAFETAYPHIASWVSSGGWVEMGHDELSQAFVKALDAGGMVWEGKSRYDTVDEALRALDAGIAAWMHETDGG